MNEGDLDAKTAAQAEMLINRLEKRSRHLKKWARRTGTSAYRLYDRDIPEIPLLLDVYEDSIVGALFERPYEKDEAEEVIWLAVMTLAISQALKIKEDKIFLKHRKRQRGSDQYEKVAEKRVLRQVREGGLEFEVNLSDYLDTGLFLDHRALRLLVRSEARDKRVLNLFSYTGSFSVHAASGGALEVDSVDLSNTYLDWAERNFKLNGFRCAHIEPEAFNRVVEPGELAFNGASYRLVRADVLRFLSEAAKAGRRWDLIVLDPPTFSNSKKMEGDLDIRRDYEHLIKACLAVLAGAGKLYFSTNARSFKLDESLFPGTKIKDLKGSVVDEDFRSRTLPACYTFSP